MGSGLAISGATLCLSLTKLNYFRTLGPPCFVAMVVAVAAALTLGPALLTLGSKIKYLDQPRPTSRMWRRIGTAIARWPVPIIAMAALVIPLAIMNLASYKVSYNDRDFAPASVESSKGYAAADRHFPTSQLSTDVLYVQSDHDMRNTTDMISLDRVTKSIYRVPGIALVQGITRPNGRAIEHASLPYALGSLGTKIGENIGFLRDRIADLDTLAAKTGSVVESTKRLEDITNQLSVGTHISRESAERLQALSAEARDHLSDYDDFFRPLRAYFYWERHCFDIPICWAIRSLIETVDSVDKITDEFGNEVRGLAIIDSVTPQIATQTHAIAANLETIRTLTLACKAPCTHSFRS